MKKTISKDDPRTKRTRKAFINAFFELLEEADFENIKINDIVKRSGYSKQAFYLHFDSKDDLVEYIINEQHNITLSYINEYVSAHPYVGESRIELSELHKKIFESATVDKRISKALHMYPCFRGFSLRFINLLMTLDIPIPLFNYRKHQHLDYFNCMAAYFLNVSIGYWIEKDFTPDIDEKVKTFMDAAFGSLTSFPIPEEVQKDFIVHQNVSIKDTKTEKITTISKQKINGNSSENCMDTLIELVLDNKALSVLSVSEKAGYSRTTFYKNFESIPDLIEKTITNEVDELCHILLRSIHKGNDKKSNMKTIWLPVFKHVEANRNKYLAFFTHPTFSTFTSKLLREIMKIDLPIVELNKVKMDKDEQGLIATAYLLFGSIQWFVTNDFGYNADQMSNLFAKSFYK